MATEIFGVKIENNPPESKLAQLGVTTWTVWEGGPMKFTVLRTTAETMYLLEGRVKVTVDGYEGSFEIGVGDLVVFPKGIIVTFEIIEAVKKYVNSEY